jgi:hypothetical protein
MTPDISFDAIGMPICVHDAVMQEKLQTGQDPLTQRASGDDTAQRDRKTCFFLPPTAKVDELFQTVRFKGKSRLMYDYPGIYLSTPHCLHDAVKREKNRFFNLAVKQTKQERSGREATRKRNSLPPQFVHAGYIPGNDKRSATPSQRPAGAQDTVLITDKPDCVTRNLAYIKTALERKPVESFNIFEPLPEAEAVPFDTAMHKPIKNMGIIRTGREAKAQIIHGAILAEAKIILLETLRTTGSQ